MNIIIRYMPILSQVLLNRLLLRHMFVLTVFTIKKLPFIVLLVGKHFMQQILVRTLQKSNMKCGSHYHHHIIYIKYLKFPLQSHYHVLPKQEEMLVTDISIIKKGILNYFNNCYILTIIQSLAETMCQRFIPSTLESDSQLISVVNVYHNTLTTSIKDSRLNLSKEFAILSKQILDKDLRKKQLHDAFKLLEKLLDKLITENLFVDEHFTHLLLNIVKCLSCNLIAGEVVRLRKDIIMPIPEQETPLVLESVLCSKCFLWNT